MYEEIWNRISNNCLKGNSVPEALKALWKEKLQGNAFLESWQFGGARLIDEYPEDIFFGYTAEFIGSQKDGDAWSQMFEEIGFFAMEEEGGLIGLWFYSNEIDSISAPVIQLDNEGQLEVLSRNIRDYPAMKAWWCTEEDDLKAAYEKVSEWSEKYNLGELITLEVLEEELTGFPNPNERFNAYYESS